MLLTTRKGLRDGVGLCPNCERFTVGYGKLKSVYGMKDYTKGRCKSCLTVFELPEKEKPDA